MSVARSNLSVWSFPAVVLVLLLAGCGRSAHAGSASKLQAQMDAEAASDQAESDRLPQASVIKAMDAQLVAVLRRATPESLEKTHPVAAGVQRNDHQVRLFVFWISPNSHGDAVAIRKIAKPEDTFIVPIPPEYIYDNKDESDGGSLRMRVTYDPSKDLKPSLEPVIANPGNYELAVMDHKSVISDWVKILEKFTPASAPATSN